MLEEAEAEGLVETTNLDVKNKELKVPGKERTIRLLTSYRAFFLNVNSALALFHSMLAIF